MNWTHIASTSAVGLCMSILITDDKFVMPFNCVHELYGLDMDIANYHENALNAQNKYCQEHRRSNQENQENMMFYEFMKTSLSYRGMLVA